MDFEFSPDQDALRETVRRFLADKAPIAYVREMYDDERGTTDAVWKGLAALGVTGLLVPEADGGAGMGMVDMGVVLLEMGRAVHPGPFLSSAVAATSALTSAGAHDLLPAIADGSLVATVARGDELSFVPDATAADVVLVAFGDELVAVERSACDVRPVATVDGSRKFGRVSFDRSAARSVGTVDWAEIHDRLTTALVVDGVGAAERAMELAVAYAKERVQFDKPIGSFQAVQHLCADMLQAVEMARAGAYYALWACDAADAGERHRAATMAKAFASEALFRVGANAIQVFGGIGFTWEHDVHLFYKRLLTLQQAYGTGTEHLEELADLILPSVSSANG